MEGEAGSPSNAVEQVEAQELLKDRAERAEALSQVELQRMIGDEMSQREKLSLIASPSPNPEEPLEEGAEMMIDFFEESSEHNRLLERQVSLADVMPEEVRRVSIQGQVGERRGLNGEFFTESGERLIILTGTIVVIEAIAEESELKEIQSEIDSEAASWEERVHAMARERDYNHDLVGISDDTERDYLNTVARRALEKGIGPAFALAVLNKENGDTRTFGVMLDEAESPFAQLDMSLKIMARYENRFYDTFGADVPVREEGSHTYTPEFIAFFSNVYTPPEITGNENDLRNLFSLYGRSSDLERGEAFLSQNQERIDGENGSGNVENAGVFDFDVPPGDAQEKILAAVQEALDRGLKGKHCWDFVDKVFRAAGFPNEVGKREVLYQASKYHRNGRDSGEYANMENEQIMSRVEAGDWLYFHNKNTSDRHGDHSGIFMGWADMGAGVANIASYHGNNRPSDIKQYNLRNMPITHITRAVD